jgi:ectoine hydroxylase-related dioxygenase (phytanoyl-CoA dioxygenase family)
VSSASERPPPTTHTTATPEALKPTSIENSYLGNPPIFNWLTANTALANSHSHRQPPHKDLVHDHPLYPHYFIANIPLCDFTIHNGATEFWLGSHAHTTQADQVVALTQEDIAPYQEAEGGIGSVIPPIRDEVVEGRRGVRPPVQPSCNKGDVVIRDLRLWHAGMPNHSDAHRVMLALGYMVRSNLAAHIQASRMEASFAACLLNNSD